MIGLVGILWLMIWGGMFADPGSMRDWSFMNGLFALVQGLRSLLPLLAVYFCLLWIFMKRARFPFVRMPLGYLFAYCGLGLATSAFISPDRWISIYYGLAYLAPLIVAWMSFEKEDTVSLLGNIMVINEFVAYGVVFALLPEVIRVGTVYNRFVQVFQLPFGLGEMRANGVGRFALAAIILAFIRLVTSSHRLRAAWLIPILPALFILAQSRSRSSFLGLAVCSLIFVFIWGLDWRFFLVGPVSAYLIWLSVFKWRLHGHVERLMYLTGREFTWQRGLEQIKQSPFLGWGFHADRLLLESEHMHNSYLHSGIQAGLFGALFFAAAVISTWVVIFKSKLPARLKSAPDPERRFLAQAVLLVGFLTARSFFESTAAFYGVDLLLFVPAACYIYAWTAENPLSSAAEAMNGQAGPENERRSQPA